MFSNATYDKLKLATMCVIPALSTFYGTVAVIWNLPNTNKILLTLSAIITFLGALLEYSSSKYNGDGTIVIDTSDPEKDVYRMELEDIPETFNNKDQVVFKVKNAAHMREE